MKILTELKNAFWHDSRAARRWLKGSLLAILPIFTQLMVTDAWMNWSFKEWIYHLIPSVIGFIYGSIQSDPKKTSP